MNARGQDLCTIDCYLKQTLNIPRGANLTLMAAPISSGYKFVDWVGTGAGSYSGTNQTMTITMYGDITEVANFMPQVSQPDAPPSISGAASALGNDLSSIFTGLMNTIINILKSL